jgi:AhpD family alkylhydroperoxidase
LRWRERSCSEPSRLSPRRQEAKRPTATSSRRSAASRPSSGPSPEAGIGGAWNEFKSVQLNPKTALSGKTKELIGLAVAAQVPCAYCVYFHTAAAKLNGANDEEIREAVAMAAITRHWSTVLNGMQIDPAAFKAET